APSAEPPCRLVCSGARNVRRLRPGTRGRATGRDSATGCGFQSPHMTLILGLHTGHEASAVLFQGTEVLAAVSNERLSRIKNDGGRLSDAAVDEVLRIAGLM